MKSYESIFLMEIDLYGLVKNYELYKKRDNYTVLEINRGTPIMGKRLEHMKS